MSPARSRTSPVVTVLVGPVLVEITSYPDVQRLRVIQLGRRRSFFLLPGVRSRR